VGTDGVEVALYQYGLSRLANPILRSMNAEQDAALVEDLGLRRVQVLWLSVAEGASTESDDAPRAVSDGKHEAAANRIAAPRSRVRFEIEDMPETSSETCRRPGVILTAH
jgi:hypothetical protein